MRRLELTDAEAREIVTALDNYVDDLHDEIAAGPPPCRKDHPQRLATVGKLLGRFAVVMNHKEVSMD